MQIVLYAELYVSWSQSDLQFHLSNFMYQYLISFLVL